MKLSDEFDQGWFTRSIVAAQADYASQFFLHIFLD